MIKFSKKSVFKEGKNMNNFNKKNEMKDDTEDALQLGKYTLSSKIQTTTCFVFCLTFFFLCAFSFSNHGE